MGEIPHSDKMFHLPIEVSVYVPSTQDVDKVVSKSEMKLRVEEVKKYLATLFGGFSSSSVEGGFLASDGKVVKENVERVVSFAEKSEFDKNKEALVQKASEWAAKWGQEAIGLEHEGDLYYVPQKFENGGTIAIREAKEMANSQAIELKHHASELANILKKNPTIEAWVIAKLERASSDLSDVTHYLEGRTQSSGSKMKNGGKVYEKMIKVKVVYLEQQYFELTKEMEIPLSVYKKWDKTGKVPIDIQSELCEETCVDNWVETNAISTIFTPITADKKAMGGGVSSNDPQFIKYKDEEIMFVPAYNSYYVNDVEFNTLDEAKNFIDGGAPMSTEIKEAYRKGLFAKGGNVLLAPNGKPSNLTPEQYKLVRTAAFKAWFGDWENDPNNASKVVDEDTKEPLVVYHGSNADFNIFEKSKTNPYAAKQGYFFAFNKNYAESYNSKYVKPFFINIRIEGTFDDDDNIVPFNADGNILQGLQIEVYDNKNIKLADGTNKNFDGNNPDIRFDAGGNMEFERPTYQSNYVASQSQSNEIADENWNMDYENDPLIKAQKKAKETATRVGMAVATRGMSEATRKTEGSEESGSSGMDIASMLKGMKR